MISRVSTVNMSREEWLERRRKSIGGSDSAAILGLSEYSSAYSVWAEKTGKVMTVEVKQVEEGLRFEESYVDIEKIVHMDLTIED